MILLFVYNLLDTTNTVSRVYDLINKKKKKKTVQLFKIYSLILLSPDN